MNENIYRAGQFLEYARQLEEFGALGQQAAKTCRQAARECIHGGYTNEHASLLGHAGWAIAALTGVLQGPAGFPALSVALELALKRDNA